MGSVWSWCCRKLFEFHGLSKVKKQISFKNVQIEFLFDCLDFYLKFRISGRRIETANATESSWVCFLSNIFPQKNLTRNYYFIFLIFINSCLFFLIFFFKG